MGSLLQGHQIDKKFFLPTCLLSPFRHWEEGEEPLLHFSVGEYLWCLWVGETNKETAFSYTPPPKNGVRGKVLCEQEAGVREKRESPEITLTFQAALYSFSGPCCPTLVKTQSDPFSLQGQMSFDCWEDTTSDWLCPLRKGQGQKRALLCIRTLLVARDRAQLKLAVPCRVLQIAETSCGWLNQQTILLKDIR